MTAVVTKDVDIVWHQANGVPISEKDKQKWVQEAIQWLKDNPDEPWFSLSSGDTKIIVKRLDAGFFEVEELQPRRWATIPFDGDTTTCVCDITILNQKGCQCGGT